MSLLMSSADIVAVAAATAVGANNAIRVVAALVTLFSRNASQVQRALKLLALYSPLRQPTDRTRRADRPRSTSNARRVRR
jgi:hypothetical protein